MEKRRPGRPPKGEEAKTAPLSMRTDAEFRARIEAAAAERNVSLAQEMERRLRLSFEEAPIIIPTDIQDKLTASAQALGLSLDIEIIDRLRMSLHGDRVWGGAHVARFLTFTAAAINRIEMRTNKKWHEDAVAWHATTTAIFEMLEEFKEFEDESANPDVERVETTTFAALTQFQEARSEERDYLMQLEVAQGEDAGHLREKAAMLSSLVNHYGEAVKRAMEESDKLMAPYRITKQSGRLLGRIEALVALGKRSEDEAAEEFERLQREWEPAELSMSASLSAEDFRSLADGRREAEAGTDTQEGNSDVG